MRLRTQLRKVRLALPAILCILAAAMLVSPTDAAQSPPAKRVINPQVYRSLQYSFSYPDERRPPQSDATREIPSQALGVAAATASPGTMIGYTWYDYQHNGSMGRMIETNFGTAALVHFSWMFLPGPVLESREYNYNSYDITNSLQGTVTGLQPADDYGGYVGLTTTNDNRAVVGGHNNYAAEGLYAPQIYWDFAEGTGFFGASVRVPRQLQEYAQQTSLQEVIWPKFRYVEGPTDTVLHIIAQDSLSYAGAPQAIYYFRRVGSDASAGTWTYPPYVIDTIYDLSHDIAATDDGKVALVWTANLPCSASDPDTASGYECRSYVQQDNDIYYQISYDYGVTFQPRVNVTHHIWDEGTDSYRPYTDLSALIDTDNNLHIAWAARAWPANSQIPGLGEPGLYRDRIFHWSENQPYIRTAHSADWDQTVCSPGKWNLNAGKMSISECNGRLYLLFVQINDIPAGVENDCAVESNPGFPIGAGNGDLYLVVSADGGLTWDRARNLTNSRTPGCDSVGGVGGPCDNDNWPSMARFGTNYALNPGDNAAPVIVPTGGVDDGWYLDVQYINDHSAGGISGSEGFWQQADVRWFRLACATGIPGPFPVFTPREIAYPTWVKPGQVMNKTITITNIGNANYTYLSPPPVVELSGPSGWLATSGFSGIVPFGISNTATGTITVDATSYSPGTVAQLDGYVVFDGNTSIDDTMRVSVVVADSIVPPIVDTLSTSCLSLVVLNNGSFGNQGADKVNMDYYNAGDCDTTATVYVYDGSPVVGWIDGADTIMNWSIFGNLYLTPVGFVQQSEGSSSLDSYNEIYTTAFSTRDTSLMIEKTYYAPQAADSCKFIIQRLRLWSGDGASHSGITFGEAVDWDVPSDSMSRNGSGFDESAGLIYQYGGEYHQDDTGLHAACQDNDLRYAGMRFIRMYRKGVDWTDLGSIKGAQTADNPTWVYGNNYGFLPGELYTRMQETGFSAYTSANPDSVYADLHTLMTYQTDYTVNPGETLVVYTALITEDNGGLTFLTQSANQAYGWLCDHVLPDPPGCFTALCGDWDGSGTVNISDLTMAVGYFFQGYPLLNPGAADVDLYQLITYRDLFFMEVAVAPPYPVDILDCPPIYEPLNPPVDTSVYLALEPAILPANDTIVSVDFRINVPYLTAGGTFPIRVSVGGTEADTVVNAAVSSDITGHVWTSFIVPADGAQLSFEYAWAPNTTALYTGNHGAFSLDVIAAAAPTDRKVTFEYVTLPPRNVGMQDLTPLVFKDGYPFEAVTPDLRDPYTCCQLHGNVDGINGVNVSDLTYLVAYLFQGGAEPPCYEEGNVDGIGAIDVSDLTYLVAYLFQGGPLPPPC